jgi:hypothetical protein
MSYYSRKLPTQLIEISLSSAQTASQNDYVLFDTLRATGTNGVTLNTVTGEIGLDTTKLYSVRASIHVERSNSTSSYTFAWHDSGGSLITPANGGYDARFEDGIYANSTYIATYQNSSPLSAIRLRATLLAASSTILTATKVIIIEVTP